MNVNDVAYGYRGRAHAIGYMQALWQAIDTFALLHGGHTHFPTAPRREGAILGSTLMGTRQ